MWVLNERSGKPALPGIGPGPVTDDAFALLVERYEAQFDDPEVDDAGDPVKEGARTAAGSVEASGIYRHVTKVPRGTTGVIGIDPVSGEPRPGAIEEEEPADDSPAVTGEGE